MRLCFKEQVESGHRDAFLFSKNKLKVGNFLLPKVVFFQNAVSIPSLMDVLNFRQDFTAPIYFHPNKL